MSNSTLTKIYLFSLVFLISINSFSQDQIISQGDQWQYFDQGGLSENWTSLSINTSNWKSGVSPLGYGDRRIITEINYGEDKANKEITKYFTKTINLENPLSYIAYEFKIQRDDGILLYLNGEEIYRNNMPDGLITSNSTATYIVQNAAESVYLSKIIDSKDFKPGKNIISVSIHQATARSSDCLFNLELIGHNNPRILSALINEKTISNFKLETQVKNLSHEFQLKNNAIQLELLKSSNDNLKFTIFMVSFLLITAVILAYFIIVRYRKKEEQDTQKILSLNKIIFDKDREMMTATTQLLHNKQHFKEIKADLNYFSKENSSSVKKLIQQIDYIIDNDEEWEHLKTHFNTVYSGFYDTLIKLHPSLTEIELRHCMFIKLHMQTKEIARILHVDPRSVQASRYRIKKKMSLSEETDLRNYILTIS